MNTIQFVSGKSSHLASFENENTNKVDGEVDAFLSINFN